MPISDRDHLLCKVRALNADLDCLTPEQIDADYLGLRTHYQALNQDLSRPLRVIDHGFQRDLVADLHRHGPIAASPITFAALGQSEEGHSIGAQLWVRLRWARGAKDGPAYRPFDYLTLGEFFDYHSRIAWLLEEKGV